MNFQANYDGMALDSWPTEGAPRIGGNPAGDAGTLE
jgi:hypothetical protein